MESANITGIDMVRQHYEELILALVQDKEAYKGFYKDTRKECDVVNRKFDKLFEDYQAERQRTADLKVKLADKAEDPEYEDDMERLKNKLRGREEALKRSHREEEHLRHALAVNEERAERAEDNADRKRKRE